MEMRQLFKTVMSLKRVALHSRYRVSIPKVKSNNLPCLIFGNGPSLDSDICDKINLVQNLDVFCVGRFAESELFRLVKPKFYVFADPMWWAHQPSEKTAEIRNRLFNHIAKDTDWKMTLCAPFEAANYLKNIFLSSPNINFLFYNNVPLWGSDPVIHTLYDYDLGMVPAQNVLVTSLFLAIRVGYKKIVVLGADHSWHETLALDEKNRVCLRDCHFYDKDASMRPFTIDGSDEKIFRMDNLFHALARMFQGYWKIADYAKRWNVEVINASSVTYIDAFNRGNVSEVLVELVESK